MAEPGVPVIGGDTTRAELVALSVTALGRASRVPGRGGAKPGNKLIVTGPLGASGAAFRDGRYVRPPVRTNEGKQLAAVAHALIDVSDGIERDASHIARRSGVRCVIELDRVPLAEGAELADLGVGEDFELLAAVEDPAGFTEIGNSFALHGSVLHEYTTFVYRFVRHGDVGRSFFNRQSVLSIIERAAPVTFSLLVGGAVIFLCIAFPIGILSAIRPRSLLDR